jgi:CheY-like chemotaxis protein
MLERLGCEVICAVDGRDGVEAAQRQSFDAIFMDVQMPVMDGLSATEELRRIERNGPHTPIIGLTAHAAVQDREACFRAGMDDQVTKPVSMQMLSDVLRRHLGEAFEAAS